MKNETEEVEEPKKGLIHKIWSIMYLAFYPVVMVFSLLFFGLSFISSIFSRIIRKILSLIKLPNQL